MRTRKTALTEESFKQTLEGKEFMSPSCGGPIRIKGGRVILNGYEDVTENCDWSKLMDESQAWNMGEAYNKMTASERAASLKDADGNDLQEGDTVVVVNDLAKEIFPSLYGQRFTITWTGMNDDRAEIKRLRLSNGPAVGGQGLFAPASFVRKEASNRMAATDENYNPIMVGDRVRYRFNDGEQDSEGEGVIQDIKFESSERSSDTIIVIKSDSGNEVRIPQMRVTLLEKTAGSYEEGWSANDANGQPLQEGDVVRAKDPNEADETSLEDYTIVGYSYPQLKVRGKDGEISYVSPSGSVKVSSRAKTAAFQVGDKVETNEGHSGTVEEIYDGGWYGVRLEGVKDLHGENDIMAPIAEDEMKKVAMKTAAKCGTSKADGRAVVAFTDSMGDKYECHLVDDGTMDTVVSCNGKEFRFSDVEREANGSLSEETLNNLFEEAIEMFEENKMLVASKKTAMQQPSKWSGEGQFFVLDTEGVQHSFDLSKGLQEYTKARELYENEMAKFNGTEYQAPEAITEMTASNRTAETSEEEWDAVLSDGFAVGDKVTPEGNSADPYYGQTGTVSGKDMRNGQAAPEDVLYTVYFPDGGYSNYYMDGLKKAAFKKTVMNKISSFQPGQKVIVPDMVGGDIVGTVERFIEGSEDSYYVIPDDGTTKLTVSSDMMEDYQEWSSKGGGPEPDPFAGPSGMFAGAGRKGRRAMKIGDHVTGMSLTLDGKDVRVAGVLLRHEFEDIYMVHTASGDVPVIEKDLRPAPKRYASIADEIQDLKARKEILEMGIDASETDDQKESFTARIDELDREIKALEAKTAMTDPRFFGHGLEHMADIEDGNIPTLTSPSTEEISDDADVPLSMRPKGEHGEGAEYKSVISRRERRKAEGPVPPTMGGTPEGLEETESKKTAEVELDENIFENDEDKEPGRFKTEDSDQSVMRSSSGGGKGYQSSGPFANPPSALPGTYASCPSGIPKDVKEKVVDEYGKDNPKTYMTLNKIKNDMKEGALRVGFNMQEQMTEIYNAKVEQYVGEGMTREEAEKKAETEVLSEHSLWAD